MARPSFKIDPNRLRSLRKESSLTQLQVAKKAHAILGKSTQTTDSTILSSYQRIERTGDTSNAMATALAQVFETTVEILQGGAPEPEDSSSVLNRIEQQLRKQKKLGSNLALEHALTKYVETYDNPIEEDDCIREFSRNIGKQIEVAQIGQNSSEIARLAELTGWSEAQLQQQGIDGYWLLLTTIHVLPETKIILGIFNVIFQIQEIFEKRWIKCRESDVRVTLHRSLPWLHLEITHPRIPSRRLKFSFVRSKPEVGGLKWVNPTWQDQFWLEYSLREWAFRNTNFFTDFDGNNSPGDVHRLRFRVRERDADGVFQRVAYSKGYQEELPEDVFQNFKAEGNSHRLVIHLLVDGLAQSLAPHLTAYPPDCWSLGVGILHNSILLDIPSRLSRTNKELVSCSGIKYTIDLIEETSPGVYQSAPWRDDSVDDVCSLLQKRMLEKLDGIEHEDALKFLSVPVLPS